MSTRHFPVAATAALALVLTACNSGGGEAEPPAGTAPPISEETSEETTSPEETPTEDDTGEDSGPDDEPTQAGTTGPEDDPTDALPDFDTELSTSGAFPGGGGDLLHSTVRIGQHENFDRVVFDFEGTGIPEYQVQYVEEPTQQGSGRPVELDGEAVLEVVVTNTRYPEEGEEYPGGPGTYDPEQVQVVEQVRLDGTYEGHTQGFIGVSSQAPFRAFALEDPVRVVVDVQHTD